MCGIFLACRMRSRQDRRRDNQAKEFPATSSCKFMGSGTAGALAMLAVFHILHEMPVVAKFSRATSR